METWLEACGSIVHPRRFLAECWPPDHGSWMPPALIEGLQGQILEFALPYLYTDDDNRWRCVRVESSQRLENTATNKETSQQTTSNLPKALMSRKQSSWKLSSVQSSHRKSINFVVSGLVPQISQSFACRDFSGTFLDKFDRANTLTRGILVVWWEERLRPVDVKHSMGLDAPPVESRRFGEIKILNETGTGYWYVGASARSFQF